MNILIISEYIAPVQAVASIRWTKVAKYIKQQHPESQITVLTNQKDFGEGGVSLTLHTKDELLEREMVYFDNYFAAPYTFPIRFYFWLKRNGGQESAKKINFQQNSVHKNFSAISKIKIALLGIVYDLKDQLSFWQLLKFLKGKNLNYDVIISSYGPFWPHLVAERIKKTQPDALWLADFRDPHPKDTDDAWSYRRHKKATMKHCAQADHIFRISDTLLTYTPSNIPVCTVTNGYDPEEKLEPLSPQKFTVVFTGMLYGYWSDIGTICKALKELCEEGKLDKKDIEVSYAGQVGELAKTLAKRYDAEEFICDYGVVPRQEALRMQQNAAILLLLGWNKRLERSLWTGKAYEYMMAKKPIIYVVTGDVPYSEPSKYIDRLGGYCYEQCRHEETYQGMKDYILEKYQEWKATGNVTVQQDKEYVEQFAYPHIAEQVWQLIQEGMKKRSESGTVKEN